MPRSSTSVMGLDDQKGRQELRPRGPSSILPLSSVIKGAHILQRELYSMGNTGLLRREAEMTLLQPQLGEMRRQELRNSSFWDPSLFQSQLVKEGEDFLLKKGT